MPELLDSKSIIQNYRNKKGKKKTHDDSLNPSTPSPAQYRCYISCVVLLPVVDSFEHAICIQNTNLTPEKEKGQRAFRLPQMNKQRHQTFIIE